jgi:hypothetical protein
MRSECGTPDDCMITGKQGCKEIAGPGHMGGAAQMTPT